MRGAGFPLVFTGKNNQNGTLKAHIAFLNIKSSYLGVSAG